MREIRILTTTKRSSNYVEIERRKQKCLRHAENHEDLPSLLEKVRKGDTAAVQEVLEASKAIIYKVVRTMPDSDFCTEERFTAASNALRRLALKELNSKDAEQFLRYDAWCVRQALLELEKKSSLRGTKQSNS